MSDKNTPLVSIITPSFNQARYLEATIQSVLQQDYPHIEYLLADGASTDGSLAIIQQYAHLLAWWVSEPDSGQADAINKGLSRATGDIVAWLNSDDVYLPGAVSQAVKVFQTHPEVGLVYGDLHSINSRGQVFNTITYAQYTLDDLLAFRIIGQPAVFMRRSVLQQAGLLDPAYQYLLDHHLWLRIAQRAALKYVPSPWAAARHHPAAKNVALAAGFGEEAFRILAWAKTQPDLHAVIASRPRRVLGGAHRLNARYLLEGGQPAASLRAYARALRCDPGFA
ncbi:MAG: glycosyltransferase, partial [Anaerolineae bacterium]|nr:glycosyltransferase [Anaerolineae bacterium]